jgi:hypothetical protein
VRGSEGVWCVTAHTANDEGAGLLLPTHLPRASAELTRRPPVLPAAGVRGACVTYSRLRPPVWDAAGNTSPDPANQPVRRCPVRLSKQPAATDLAKPAAAIQVACVCVSACMCVQGSPTDMSPREEAGHDPVLKCALRWLV